MGTIENHFHTSYSCTCLPSHPIPSHRVFITGAVGRSVGLSVQKTLRQDRKLQMILRWGTGAIGLVGSTWSQCSRQVHPSTVIVDLAFFGRWLVLDITLTILASFLHVLDQGPVSCQSGQTDLGRWR